MPLLRRSSSLETGLHITAGSLVSGLVVCFAFYFPFLLSPHAAMQTYHFAFWKYDSEMSHFDNTPWTFGTDYFLAISMALLALYIPRDHPAGWKSRGLLCMYLLSVTAGGIAHQFYTTVDDRNTKSFRIWWSICVGTVAAGSGFMGAAATDLLQYDKRRGTEPVLLSSTGVTSNSIRNSKIPLPAIPNWSWMGYAICTVITVLAGGFSFQRPACDIFVVGITQFPSTFYMMLILAAGFPHCHALTLRTRVVGCLAFVLNAPLLPLYPILVVYTDWSLATINTFLHSWLWMTWTLQGMTLKAVGQCILDAEQREHAYEQQWASSSSSAIRMKNRPNSGSDRKLD
jgi:hypothetical protein